MADEEDEEELAQWMPICDDCDNPVEHYCTTCGDKLCTGCKDQHLSRRKNRGHQTVPYSAGIRASQKSQITCSNHPGERYQLYCKPCQTPVCTPCVAESHSGHAFIKIPDALSVAREKAVMSLQTLTKDVSPRVRAVCEKAQISETEVLQAIEQTKQEMMMCNKRLKEAADLTLEENLNLLEEIQEEMIMPLVQKQKKESDDVHKNVQQTTKEYEDNLRSREPVNLLVFMKDKMSDDPNLTFPSPAIQQVSLPKFQAGSISKEIIQSQFGSLSLPNQ